MVKWHHQGKQFTHRYCFPFAWYALGIANRKTNSNVICFCRSLRISGQILPSSNYTKCGPHSLCKACGTLTFAVLRAQHQSHFGTSKQALKVLGHQSLLAFAHTREKPALCKRSYKPRSLIELSIKAIDETVSLWVCVRQRKSPTLGQQRLPALLWRRDYSKHIF